MVVFLGLFAVVLPSCASGTSPGGGGTGGSSSGAGGGGTSGKGGGSSSAAGGGSTSGKGGGSSSGAGGGSSSATGGGSSGTGVGAACVNDSDCSVPLTTDDTTYEIRGFCKKNALTTQGYDGFAYPHGYCTKRCGFEEDSCGSGGACVIALGLFGEYDNQCLATCTASTNCRDGYGCLRLTSTLSVCLPLGPDGGTPSIVDAGVGVRGVAAAACSADTQCRPPSDGYCVPETKSDGGASGYPQGICAASCGAVVALPNSDEWCGNAGQCNAYAYALGDGKGPIVSWECDQGCGDGWDAGCRSGFVCGAQAGEVGHCVPDCHTKGAECYPGSTCDSSGLCQ